MKIRIKTKLYNKWCDDIRDRAENGEWETWTIVEVESLKNPEAKIRRLIHVPGNDRQYEDIQLMLCTPSNDKQVENYLDIVPKLRKGAEMDEEEFHAKSAIVLGRFCEILNRYFPNLKAYSVILK